MGGPISGNYVNNQEIMAWLTEHMGKMGEQVQDSMLSAEHRLDMLKDLEDLKGKLANAKTVGYDVVAKQIDDLLAKYPDSPEVAAMSGDLNNAKQTLLNAQNQMIQGDPDGAEQSVSNFTGAAKTDLDNTIEGLKKDDQMAMIKLQDASSQQNEAMQMVTNLLQAQHSSAMSILGNIKG